MLIGVPKEVKVDEFRVALVPAGVRALTGAGHQVVVQSGAGLEAGLSDQDFLEAGAVMVSREEAWAADLVVKVKEPIAQEYQYLRPGLTLFTYLHLAAVPELAQELISRQVTAVAYETIQLEDFSLPLLTPMSEVAGRMAVQAGAHYLERQAGGRGLLLGGVPGVRRGRVTILGAGVVGTAALKIAVGIGAEVTVLDRNLRRLTYLDDIFGSRITTLISLPDTVARSVAAADLLIGAVLIAGARAPRLVSEEMVMAMNPGSVIVDVSVDQGGCVATIRPTTHEDPIYTLHGVIHYGVTNMPGAVSRTSTFALTNVTLPYVLALAGGPLEAARRDPALAKGFNTHAGAFTHPEVAQSLGAVCQPLW
ncbi:MAG: alanine dehydrogenase [Desulfarculus sp.]|nr:alanine dehydrogenase [Desulfarculus sp.]